MKLYRITVETKSAFGSLLKGDTLFGQLCWAILNRHGEQRLQELLSDYLTQPFAVCSDGFPHGYLPRPSLPVRFFDFVEGEDRKAVKKKCWINIDDFSVPLKNWLENAKSDSDLAGSKTEETGWWHPRPQPHNSINRLTGTTGSGMFAPYSQEQTWYPIDARFDIFLLLDETRLSQAEMNTAFSDTGVFGYGRDASIGLGKFECTEFVEWKFADIENANACLTLAPCAPQGLGMDSESSYYNVFTRFGRHGDIGVHKEHGPFKAPVLLADTAAVFPFITGDRNYIGQGITGVSKAIPATVHQGYAPYVPIHLPPHVPETP